MDFSKLIDNDKVKNQLQSQFMKMFDDKNIMNGIQDQIKSKIKDTMQKMLERMCGVVDQKELLI